MQGIDKDKPKRFISSNLSENDDKRQHLYTSSLISNDDEVFTNSILRDSFMDQSLSFSTFGEAFKRNSTRVSDLQNRLNELNRKYSTQANEKKDQPKINISENLPRLNSSISVISLDNKNKLADKTNISLKSSMFGKYYKITDGISTLSVDENNNVKKSIESLNVSLNNSVMKQIMNSEYIKCDYCEGEFRGREWVEKHIKTYHPGKENKAIKMDENPISSNSNESKHNYASNTSSTPSQSPIMLRKSAGTNLVKFNEQLNCKDKEIEKLKKETDKKERLINTLRADLNEKSEELSEYQSIKENEMASLKKKLEEQNIDIEQLETIILQNHENNLNKENAKNQESILFSNLKTELANEKEEKKRIELALRNAKNTAGQNQADQFMISQLQEVNSNLKVLLSNLKTELANEKEEKQRIELAMRNANESAEQIQEHRNTINQMHEINSNLKVLLSNLKTELTNEKEEKQRIELALRNANDLADQIKVDQEILNRMMEVNSNLKIALSNLNAELVNEKEEKQRIEFALRNVNDLQDQNHI